MQLVKLGVGAFLLTLVLTWCVRIYALRTSLLDVPNERSSHALPTARGGGVAIVVTVLIGLCVLYLTGGFAGRLELAIVPSAVAVAAVGFLDDRYALSARLRLLIHFVAVTSFVWMLFSLGSTVFDVSAGVNCFVALQLAAIVLALVWLLNLYNFMDGIDGLAASELVFFSAGLISLYCAFGVGSKVVSLSVVMLGSAFGFLVWNWAPAKIFMGDVGSGFLGLVVGMIGCLAVWSGVNFWVPIILLAAFIVDASVTLARRIVRGDRWFEPHRTHAYQWLSRRWRRHHWVVLAYMAINFGWLLPMAVWAQSFEGLSARITLIAYLPLIGLALAAGSGRNEVQAVPRS